MKQLFILIIAIFLIFHVKSQENEKREKILSVGASYTADNMGVLSGGLKRGYDYLGLAHLHLTFNTENAGWWKGGTIFLNGANTHGGTPSESLIGDFQIASNIEAGKHTYVQELWIKQELKNFEFTIGLQDLNVEIATVENGENFINSSFGILPIISGNLMAPIFPLTSIGVTTKWDINEKTSWLNAIYDGTPTDFDENPYNLKWEFNSGDGLLYVTELQQKASIFGKNGIYKLGFFTHNHTLEKTVDKHFPDSLNTNIMGVYFIQEQDIYQNNGKEITSFIQTGFSPSKMSINKFYLGMGMNFNGFLSKKNDDSLGLALALAQLRADFGHEITWELSWKKPITSYFFIQPDFQYIIHPAGSKSKISNAFVGMVRFGLDF